MRLFVRLVLLIMVIILGLMTYPVISAATRFAGHYRDISTLIAAARDDDVMKAPAFREMLLFSFHGNPAPYAGRLLLFKYEVPPHQLFAFELATWKVLGSLLISKDDQLTIIAVLAPTGGARTGLDETAVELFGKHLDHLSPVESATVIVLMNQPSLASHQDQLAARSDAFLVAYQTKGRMQ